MTSGPVVVQVLEGEGAIAKNRELMGATNPSGKRLCSALFVLTLLNRSTPMPHDRDFESAAREVAHFFAASDICPRQSGDLSIMTRTLSLQPVHQPS